MFQTVVFSGWLSLHPVPPLAVRESHSEPWEPVSEDVANKIVMITLFHTGDLRLSPRKITEKPGSQPQYHKSLWQNHDVTEDCHWK